MYTIEFTSSAQKEILHLPVLIQQRLEPIFNNLERQPRPHGCKKITGRLNTWRIRIGDYRILYEINDRANMILVFHILHRKEIYR
jgi:mRNA interferase RelE/StbE